MGDGDHHVLVGDHVLDGDVVRLRDDLGAPLVAIGGAQLTQLALDLLQHELIRAEDGTQPLDQEHQLLVLLDHFLALEPGQALQAHVEDGLGLGLGEFEATDQVFTGLGRRLAGADGGDHLVQMIERLEDAFQDVSPLFGLAQVVAGAPDDHRLPMVEEVAEQLLERHHLRLVVHDGQQDDAEGGLHRRQLVQRVEDDLRDVVLASLRRRCGCRRGRTRRAGRRPLRSSSRGPARRCAR